MASAPHVTTKMHYGLTPVAVESKAHILTLPCTGADSYPGDTSSNIVFRIQHNPSGWYVDSSATKIKFTFSLSLPNTIRDQDAFFFERGPESLIRRFQIKDIQGRVLEDLDNYNLTYAVTEICTNSPDNRSGRDMFSMEGNSTWQNFGGWIKHPTEGFQNNYGVQPIAANYAAQTITFDVTFTPFSAIFGGACDKYIPLSALEGMEINIQLETCGNAIKYCWVPYPTSDASIQALVTATKAAGMNAGYYTSHSRRSTALLMVLRI